MATTPDPQTVAATVAFTVSVEAVVPIAREKVVRGTLGAAQGQVLPQPTRAA